MSDKFVKSKILLDFRGGKNISVESDLIDATEANECQNINLDSQIGLRPRKGATIDGSFSQTSDPIKSSHKYTTKNGLERAVRSSGTILEYKNPYVATPDWFTLDTGFTSGKEFGFADGDGYLYMGNAFEAMRKWSGACARVDLANSTDTVLAFKAEGDLSTTALLNFSATGEVIIYANGVATKKTYSGVSGLTLTGLTGLSALTMADDDPVAETPITSGFTGAPLGNILLIKDSRLIVAGVIANPNTVYGSKVGNVVDFSFSSPAVADDGFVLKFWGKPITSLADKGDYIAVGKKDGIKKIYFQTLQSPSTETQLTIPTPSTVFMGEGLGTINNKGTLNLDYDVIFTSEQMGLRKLSRADGDTIDKPSSLTDKILPDFDTYDVSDCALGQYKQQLHLALKSSVDVSGNNLIVLYDRIDNYVSIYKGLNANNFFIYKNKLYYGDSYQKNCYQMYSDDYSDFDGTNYYPYEVKWKSKFFNYDEPEKLKELRRVYIEGFILPSTNITIKFHLEGEKGITTIEKTIVGTANYVQPLPSITLGINPFGVRGFASSDGTPTGLRKFRRIIIDQELLNNKWFGLQFEVTTNSEGANFVISKILPELFIYGKEKTNFSKTLNEI